MSLKRRGALLAGGPAIFGHLVMDAAKEPNLNRWARRACRVTRRYHVRFDQPQSM